MEYRRFMFLANPRVLFRMSNNESNPIRTPSFNPQVNFYVFLFPRNETSGITRDLLYTNLTMAHYSNGQAGAFYEGNAINTRDGNFSTDYLEQGISYHAPKCFFKHTNITVREHIMHLTRESNLDDQYETARLTLKTDMFWQKKDPWVCKKPFGCNWLLWTPIFAPSLTVSRSFGYHYLDRLAGIRANEWDMWNFTAELAVRGPNYESFSWYFRYDYGHDYYNINFPTPINRLQFGLCGNLNMTIKDRL